MGVRGGVSESGVWGEGWGGSGMVVAVWWGGERDGAIPICFPSPPQLSESELWCVRFQDLIICEYGMSDL